MLKDELMKKIALQKTDVKVLLKNHLLLSGFLEQIRHFINKSIYQMELQQMQKNEESLLLQGQAASPHKQTIEFGGGRKLNSDAEIVEVANMYLDKLKQIVKIKKIMGKRINSKSPGRGSKSPVHDK